MCKFHPEYFLRSSFWVPQVFLGFRQTFLWYSISCLFLLFREVYSGILPRIVSRICPCIFLDSDPPEVQPSRDSFWASSGVSAGNPREVHSWYLSVISSGNHAEAPSCNYSGLSSGICPGVTSGIHPGVSFFDLFRYFCQKLVSGIIQEFILEILLLRIFRSFFWEFSSSSFLEYFRGFFLKSTGSFIWESSGSFFWQSSWNFFWDSCRTAIWETSRSSFFFFQMLPVEESRVGISGEKKSKRILN